MTNQMFAPGEVAILLIDGQGGAAGEEVTILRADNETMGGDGYWFKGAHNSEWWVETRYLRKKQPPAEDRKLVSWDSCPWQPESIHV
jgi:hypothetical protein